VIISKSKGNIIRISEKESVRKGEQEFEWFKGKRKKRGRGK